MLKKLLRGPDKVLRRAELCPPLVDERVKNVTAGGVLASRTSISTCLVFFSVKNSNEFVLQKTLNLSKLKQLTKMHRTCLPKKLSKFLCNNTRRN